MIESKSSVNFLNNIFNEEKFIATERKRKRSICFVAE